MCCVSAWGLSKFCSGFFGRGQLELYWSGWGCSRGVIEDSFRHFPESPSSHSLGEDALLLQ